MSGSPRHPAYDLTNDELRRLCRSHLHGTPKGGLARARRNDLLTWVIVNGLMERAAEAATRRAAGSTNGNA